MLSFSLSLFAQKLTRFSESVSDELLYGYLNEKGDTIVPAGKYLNLPKTIKKNILVQYRSDPEIWVMLDPSGKEIYRIFTISENPDSYSNGLLRIIENDKIGFIDKKGNVVIPPEYCQATSFSKGKSIVNAGATKVDKSATDTQSSALWEGGKWGVVDKKGRVVKKLEYTCVWNDSLRCYEYDNGKEKFRITEKGKIVTVF